MDKKQLLGLGLIMLLMGMWLYMNQPSEAERLEIERKRDSLSRAENIEPLLSKSSEDSSVDFIPYSSADSNGTAQNNGVFHTPTEQEEEIITLENDKMKISLSTRGGRITEVWLKDYQKIMEDEEQEEVKVPLRLLEDKKDRFEYLFSIDGREISTQNLIFTPVIRDHEIRFRAQAGTDGYIEQIYHLAPESFLVKYEVKWEGIRDHRESVVLNWLTYLDKLEKNTTFERTYSTIHYKPVDSRATYTSYTRNDNKEIGKPVKWVSHSNQFFNTTLLADQSFSDGSLVVTTIDQDGEDLKKLHSRLEIPNRPGTNHVPLV